MRQSKELEQKDLAEEIHVTYNVISNWELGRSNPSAEQLYQLADYFNVTIDYLVGRELDKKSLPQQERVLLEIFAQIAPDRREEALAILETMRDFSNPRD